jgi:hypothetical protein
MNRYLAAALMAAMLAAWSPHAAQAQVFTFGPKAGFTFTGFNVDETSLDESINIDQLPGGKKVGVTAGAFFQFNIGFLNLQPEILFTQQTSQLAFSDVSISDIQKVRFNQLDIPLLVGLNLGKTVRLQAGPVMNYVLDVGTDPGAGNLVQAVVQDFDNRAWSYQVGGGLDLGRLALDVRYGSTFGKREVGFDLDGTTVPVHVGRQGWTVTAGIMLIK